MTPVARAIAAAVAKAPADRPLGTLAPIGRFPLGQEEPEEYVVCLDCETTFPGDPTSCNGSRIERCPWCREDSQPWTNGRGA